MNKRVLVSLISVRNGIFASAGEVSSFDFDAVRERIEGFLETIVGLHEDPDGSWHGDRELVVCLQGNEPLQLVASLISVCFYNGVKLTLSYLDEFDCVQRQKMYY